MEFYTIKAVAKILSVCPKTVVSLIRDGKLWAVEIGGTKRISFRVHKKELDRFVAENAEKYRKKKFPRFSGG